MEKAGIPEKDATTPRPCPDGGLELEGLGRLVGSRVFDKDGNQIPMVRDIEYVHRVNEPPLIRVTCFASKVNAAGKVEMVIQCPSCGAQRTDETRDASTLGSEWAHEVPSRVPVVVKK